MERKESPRLVPDQPSPSLAAGSGMGALESLPPRPLTLARPSTGLAYGLEILEAASQSRLRRRLWSIRGPGFP